MKKLSAAAALTALALGFAVPITMAVPSAAQTVNATSAAPIMSGHSMRAGKMIGTAVYNAKGDRIGAIEDVLLNKGTGTPMVVLSVGDFVGGGPKLVAVPLTDITIDADKPVMMAATQKMLMAMPSYSFGSGVN